MAVKLTAVIANVRFTDEPNEMTGCLPTTDGKAYLVSWKNGG